MIFNNRVQFKVFLATKNPPNRVRQECSISIIHHEANYNAWKLRLSTHDLFCLHSVYNNRLNSSSSPVIHQRIDTQSV